MIFIQKIGILWPYSRDEPVLNNNGNIIDFHNDDNNSIKMSTANNRTNGKQFHKRCWNNDSIKTSK